MNYRQALTKKSEGFKSHTAEIIRDFDPPLVNKLCRNYQRAGRCRFGGKCRWIHKFSQLSDVLESIILPDDILRLIFQDVFHYIFDLMLVCTSWHRLIITRNPLQTYIFTDVMNGGYCYGCAISVARSKNDAIYQICKRLYEPNSLKMHRLLPKSDINVWIETHKFRNNSHDEILSTMMTKHSEFQIFLERLKNDFGFPDNTDGGKNFAMCCSLYDELKETDAVFIIPRDYAFSYFCGGGS